MYAWKNALAFYFLTDLKKEEVINKVIFLKRSQQSRVNLIGFNFVTFNLASTV